MNNSKKIVGTAIAAAASAIPFLGGNASADQVSSFRDTSVDDAQKATDDAKNTPTYTVQSGDTLSSVADVTGVSVDDLMKFNHLNTSSVIVSGDQLKLSAGEDNADEASDLQAADNDGVASSAAGNNGSAAVQNNKNVKVTNTAASNSTDVTLAALNSMRVSAGLPALSWDSSLAAKAQGRAAQVAALGGIPADHFKTSGEVIAIGWGAGSSVISAWYNETNMIGGPGHRNWEMNASYTHVGFGYVNGVIVGEAR
ncbi:CAP domain-containing protein [Weissella kandleri]|uniref:CAP domain-containing protein n=1 Tax=Weissella kandleri TaxID=1616 RepID=UPI00387EA787